MNNMEKKKLYIFIYVIKYEILEFLENTVLQKKKVYAPEMRTIYCDRYGPIEKPYIRRLSRSKRVAEI